MPPALGFRRYAGLTRKRAHEKRSDRQSNSRLINKPSYPVIVRWHRELQYYPHHGTHALVDWLATDPTGSGDADFLIIGDLNSYDKEDPIDACGNSTVAVVTVTVPHNK